MALAFQHDEDLFFNPIAGARVTTNVFERARRKLELNNTIRRGVAYDIHATYTVPKQEFEKKCGILEKLTSNGDNRCAACK